MLEALPKILPRVAPMGARRRAEDEAFALIMFLTIRKKGNKLYP